jgi:methyl-accepting chemotaxis protein
MADIVTTRTSLGSKVGKATLKTMDTLTLGVASKFTSAIESTLFDRIIQKLRFQGKITLITLPLTLIALAGVGGTFFYTYEDYKRTNTLIQANHFSRFVIEAEAMQSHERVATLVTALNPSDQSFMNVIETSRRDGDERLDSALAQIKDFTRDAIAADQIERVHAARQKRDLARIRLNETLGKRVSPDDAMGEFAAKQLQLINLEHELSRTVFMLSNVQPSANPFGNRSNLHIVLELNREIQDNALYAAEFAGQERTTLGGLIASTTPISMEQLQELQRFRGIVDDNLSQIVKREALAYLSDSVRGSIQRMKKSFMYAFENKRNALYTAGVTGAQGMDYGTTSHQWYDDATAAIGTILDVAHATNRDIIILAEHERKNAVRNMAVVLVLVVALLFVWMLARRIARSILIPVMTLRAAAQSVAAGDVTQHIDHTWRDELGDLATSFNAMVASIKASLDEIQNSIKSVEREKTQTEKISRMIERQREYLGKNVQEMLASVEEFAKGDLTQSLSARRSDEIGELFDGYTRALQTVRNTIQNISLSVDSTADASQQIAAGIEEMSAGFNEQAGQAAQVSAAVEEMMATISQNAHQTSRAAEKSIDMSRAALQGGETIQKLISGLNKISDVVVRSSESVQKLGRNSVEIGEIAQAIEEIADQTNLLALNAAIEAARAGEHGRGFAVVADEVRKLAERTQKATQKIASTLKEIQTDTNDVVGVMDTGMRQAELGKSYINGASVSLQNIIYQTAEVADILSQLAASAEQQSATSNEIAESMFTISNTVTQSASTVEEISRTIADISAMASDLQRKMRHFKV